MSRRFLSSYNEDETPGVVDPSQGFDVAQCAPEDLDLAEYEQKNMLDLICQPTSNHRPHLHVQKTFGDTLVA